MSQQKIQKEDVANAIDALKRGGRQVSLPAIRAALGNKGSMTTIQELKKQLDDAEAANQDPPHALIAFRQIWVEAVNLGRAQRDSEIADLQEVNRTISSELRILEGEVIAARTLAVEAMDKYEVALKKLSEANDALIKARQESDHHSSRFMNAVEQHQEAMRKEKELFNAEQARAHDLELHLARAETKLELANMRNSKGRSTVRSRA